MFQQLHVKICVIIILDLLHIAWSYRVHHLDVNEANQVVPMLRRVLQGYEIPNYAEVRLRKSRHRFQPVGKSMFVKRIIPHGYKTGEYEYDSRLNTVFKPLFRYHVGTPSTEHERSVVRGQESKQSNEISPLILLLMKERKPLQSEKLKQNWLLLKSKKANRKRKRFSGLLNLKKIKAKPHLLRHLEKSGERYEASSNGVDPNAEQQATAEKKADSHQRFPFWNYWTYEKTVVHDECPGNLVRLGNMCVSSIGHRRQQTGIDGTQRRAIRHKPRKLRYG
ncbi:hypothetical protein HF086_008479 [Spodoptera exigua]|uniref:Uncharacterized protein n=1 Tax=Spodoptera exigua TaxID=7107 RepID=A0A922M931_SPOEX|nr:hypothetical protein HF086_008479 [Spodoptera exigua]